MGAPTCLSVQLYKCDNNVTVCNDKTGELLCREDPVYGGTGQIDNKNMDEPGYILQPPCLWAKDVAGYGLEVSPDVSGFKLGAIKTSNANYGHHGEMAWLQTLWY